MKIFYLNRVEDESGISGTGRVAQGFVADNGKVALFWLSEHPSVTIYDNIGEVRAIHSHEGKTDLIFDPEWKRAYGEVASALEGVSVLEMVQSRLPAEGAAAKLLKNPVDKP